MAEAAIPVDLFNPGQVFACIGLVEAADVLLGDAEGVFDWSDAGRVVFRIRAQGAVSPVSRALEFLDKAEARAIAPAGSVSLDERKKKAQEKLAKKTAVQEKKGKPKKEEAEDEDDLSGWPPSWGPQPLLRSRDLGYSFPDPSSPETLVCELSDGEHVIVLDHWGDGTDRDNVKFWAGAAGYPGAARVRDALMRVRGRARVEGLSNPFAVIAATEKKSSVRLDWRRDYIPIDLGFSLDKHDDEFLSSTYPLVEVLGVIGLGNARPRRLASLAYEYCVSGREHDGAATWLPLPMLRAMLGGAVLPWPTRRFRARLGRPNDYDRTFTTVTEENIA